MATTAEIKAAFDNWAISSQTFIGNQEYLGILLKEKSIGQ